MGKIIRKEEDAPNTSVVDYKNCCVEVCYTRKSGMLLRKNKLLQLIEKSRDSGKKPMLILGFSLGDHSVIQLVCEVQKIGHDKSK